MILHVIVNDRLTTPDPLPPETHAELMARPHGQDSTIGATLAQGYPVCASGNWIVPNPVFTSAGLIDPTELTYSTGVDDNENPTSHLEARDASGELVHRSGSILMRKGVVVKDPTVYPVATEYGPMLSSDLESRNPSPNVQEYWKQLTPEQVASKAMDIQAEQAAVATGNGPEVRRFESRETVHGVKVYQLVQRSAIA